MLDMCGWCGYCKREGVSIFFISYTTPAPAHSPHLPTIECCRRERFCSPSQKYRWNLPSFIEKILYLKALCFLHSLYCVTGNYCTYQMPKRRIVWKIFDHVGTPQLKSELEMCVIHAMQFVTKFYLINFEV